jgi:hypothetical protein
VGVAAAGCLLGAAGGAGAGRPCPAQPTRRRPTARSVGWAQDPCPVGVGVAAAACLLGAAGGAGGGCRCGRLFAWRGAYGGSRPGERSLGAARGAGGGRRPGSSRAGTSSVMLGRIGLTRTFSTTSTGQRCRAPLEANDSVDPEPLLLQRIGFSAVVARWRVTTAEGQRCRSTRHQRATVWYVRAELRQQRGHDVVGRRPQGTEIRSRLI